MQLIPNIKKGGPDGMNRQGHAGHSSRPAIPQKTHALSLGSTQNLPTDSAEEPSIHIEASLDPVMGMVLSH